MKNEIKVLFLLFLPFFPMSTSGDGVLCFIDRVFPGDRFSPAMEAPAEILADNGYFSDDNVKACLKKKMIPYIAVNRERHHLTVEDLRKNQHPPPEDADEVEEIKHQLKTPKGRAVYGERKCRVEPVFGIIKAVMGFRQFSLWGHQAVDSEWDLVSIAWNLKRIHRIWNSPAYSARLFCAERR